MYIFFFRNKDLDKLFNFPEAFLNINNTVNVTLCKQGFFSNFLSSALFFSKLTFSKSYFGNTIRVSNTLDPGQARHFVGPDLGPNCLER